jgi:class 3 adenylate cyclase
MVGRRRPLRRLQGSLEDAAAGRPRLALLVGEAGIGKTRLAEELAAQASASGFLVCAARCDERLQEPYGPLLDSLFPLLRGVERVGPLSPRTDQALRALLGQHDASPNPIREILESPEAASRYDTRLLIDLSDLAIGLAQRERLLLMVDDLAWADPSTFRFVVRLALRAADLRRRAHIPLLVVATTRPELEQARLLELDRLRREEISTSIELEGLDLLETAELLRDLDVPEVTWSLAEQVHRATTGNPLFVETVARRLATEGGAAAPDSQVFAEIPLEIRVALAESLERLSRDCRAILRIASVVGRECPIDALAALAATGGAEFEDALEEARAQRIIEVVGDRLLFRHPLYRTTLYQSIQPARRRGLHARIAEGLEKHGPSAGLAEHLIAAGPEVAPATVGRCCAAAAGEAAAVFAWREAARFYREAVAAEDRAPGVFEGESLARLLQAAGVACDLAMDAAMASRFLARAAELFERLNDHEGGVQTGLARVRSLVAHGDGRPSEESFQESVDSLATSLEKLSGDEALRATALAGLAELYWAKGDFPRATEIGREAYAAGRASGSIPGLVRSQIVLGLSAMIQLDLRGGLELLEGARREAFRAADPRLAAEGSSRQPLLQFWTGRVAEAEARARDAEEVTRQVNDPVLLVVPLAARVCIAVARGDLAEADECTYESLLIQRLTGYTWVNGMFLPALATLQARRGDAAAARRTMALAAESWDGTWKLPTLASWFGELYVMARSGDLTMLRAELDRHPRRAALPPMPFLGPAAWACVLVEIADMIERPALAEGVLPLLEDALGRGQVFTAGLQFHLPRVLGTAERLVGRTTASIARLRRAIVDTAASGAWVEHALSLRELARSMALGDAEQRALASPVARAARDALAGLGLEAELPAAERVLAELRHAASLAEARRDAAQPLAILFTDVEGSTPLVERLGDARAFDVLQEHERLVRDELAAWGGHEVDQEGDSFFATFEEVEHAARCALGIQRSLARLPLGDTVRLRIGVHVGDVLREEERVFGLNVIVASRIAAAAEAGEILVSDAVRDALGTNPNLRFGPAREVELKGLSRRHHVLPLLWSESAGR